MGNGELTRNRKAGGTPSASVKLSHGHRIRAGRRWDLRDISAERSKQLDIFPEKNEPKLWLRYYDWAKAFPVANPTLHNEALIEARRRAGLVILAAGGVPALLLVRDFKQNLGRARAAKFGDPHRFRARPNQFGLISLGS
jgi:hypothetical protein